VCFGEGGGKGEFSGRRDRGRERVGGFVRVRVCVREREGGGRITMAKMPTVTVRPMVRGAAFWEEQIIKIIMIFFMKFICSFFL
jgi:hypothetical protein